MKERGYIYTLTEAEKNAVKYAIDYFFESVPYIMDSFTRQEAAEKASFASVVNDLQSFCDRMEGGGASE